jgi:PAS domain S-box-containing protein
MEIRPSGSSGTPRSRVLLGVGALVLMAIAGVSYYEWQQYNRATAEAVRTREIEGSLDALNSSLVDAESGQRGFLLTGQDRYLQPYNQAVGAIPDELAQLHRLLAARPSQSADLARLDKVVNGKLAEMRQTIELRRTQGKQPALDIVLSDRGQREMQEIRALCGEIRGREYSAQNQSSSESEAAAKIAVLATVVGSIALLFLFSFRLQPYASPEPGAQQRPWFLRYGAAVLVVAGAALFRAGLTPIMGGRTMPFTLFFPAVWFAAWYGGFRPGLLSIALSVPVASYFFAEPTGSLLIKWHDDQVAMLMLVLVGFGMALLSRSQRQAVERAAQAENAEHNERLRFETTLGSIGDAVIATDAEGRTVFVNKVAQSLLRAPAGGVLGRHLDDVFRIVNENTRAPVESPVARVLREGEVVGLANHTVLIAQDGAEIPIDDSGAPIRGEGGKLVGTVLVFRDITQRRATEKRLAAQAAELRQRIHLLEPVHCFVDDMENRIVYWNQGAVDMYGFSAKEAAGQISYEFLKTVFPEPLGNIRARLMTEGQWEGELVQTRKDGSQLTVASHWALHRDEEGRPAAILKVNTDITDRKLAEEAQRQSELNAQLLRIQDEERRRIGRDLHDSAGQTLVMLKMNLDWLESGSGLDGDGREKVAECVQMADGLIKETRTTSYTLYPPMLEDVGLKSAIPIYLDGLMQRTGIEARLEIPSEFSRLPPDVELALFRVLQEGLTNVVRHSGSRVVDIRLGMEDGTVRMEIADQGKGIPPEVLEAFQRESPGKLGVGLRGMKERIRQLGGRLSVTSTAGGTVVTAAVACGKIS